MSSGCTGVENTEHREDLQSAWRCISGRREVHALAGFVAVMPGKVNQPKEFLAVMAYAKSAMK